jgi:transcription-repair coupling factor (superfamily II helicase)
VFVLCPTTLLAKQHATLVASRLEPFGHKVELLNRFRTSKERTAILEGIKDASVQVVVGTQVRGHRDGEMERGWEGCFDFATLHQSIQTTHGACGLQALLSKEVDYSHVALLVIDEEQRFGVAQKETITNLKSKVSNPTRCDTAWLCMCAWEPSSRAPTSKSRVP